MDDLNIIRMFAFCRHPFSLKLFLIKNIIKIFPCVVFLYYICIIKINNTLKLQLLW